MSSHSRKSSSKAALPRRSTRGPLDGDDPLSPSSLPASPAPKSPASSVVSQLKNTVETEERTEPLSRPGMAAVEQPESEDKDLSFILDVSVYHPLSQLEVPSSFRRPLPQPGVALSDPTKAFQELDALLSQCDYLGAAYLAGALLSSGVLKATDQRSIFRALQIRYACLELSGNVLLAAQEAKALEDLGSAFYYEGLPEDEALAEPAVERGLPRHIMPFSLRLQALRLQSIGFSDPRRGVASLYDLGLECRENLASADTSEEHRRLWAQRLEEVGIRVVNALIEMGDLECARRTLDNMTSAEATPASTWVLRKAMLCLKMGLVGEARRIMETSGLSASQIPLLNSLVAVAEDRLDDAVDMLMSPASDADKGLSALARQNAAVALLYKGRIQEAKSLMETLIGEQESFSTLTINLATVYDLTSDRSRELKTALASKIASDHKSKQPRSFTNADFKL